jgi:precorrin-8X/cobalt-precorrin-8 methylmutase
MKIDPLSIKPHEIEARSFAIIDSEVPEPRPFQGAQWEIVRRMIHTTADFEMLSIARFHPAAVDAGIKALLNGCTVVTDTNMARAGITSARMDRLGCRVECFIKDENVKHDSLERKITRAHAAIDFACLRLGGGIYVVGNAPTALIRLLDRVREKKCSPSLVVGMPVGFVNAVESKDYLMMQEDVPYITIKGRKGGSALAAAVVNQLAVIALREAGK